MRSAIIANTWRRLAASLLLLLICASPAAAQDPAPSADNPLAILNAELEAVLAAAGEPFAADQTRAIALMMEDRRRASENLFGDLMDFRAGPTQGQEEDRLRSAIEWMRNEFIRSVVGYMTPAQADIWARFQAERLTAGANGDPAQDPSDGQTQYVRINNNSFTAEDNRFFGGGGGGFTEVIPRGGMGAWHGNAQFLLKDDALNARNPFAGNKPPYQERRLNVDVSGPLVPGRLTTSVDVASTEAKDATTVRATLPDGVFALGITRPDTYREVGSRSTLQLAAAHSLRVDASYGMGSRRNQGIGGFTLPERASTSKRRSWNTQIRQFSAPSSGLFEARLQVNGGSGETHPLSEAVRINVLDAFNGGGAQNRSERTNRSYNANTLFTRVGETVTIKTGAQGIYRRAEAFSTNDFGGTFTFSSLEDYLAGVPIAYRVTRGTPLLRTTQMEGAAFLQADISLSSRFTLMVGARYDAQSNLDDLNNLAPRLSFAYAPGEATVVRGGLGLYYDGVDLDTIENQRRFDGQRQFEIVIDQPSYPDPFVGGTIRQTFPSVRVTDPDLVSPYRTIGLLSIERTLRSTLLLTASYQFGREFHRLRVRNLNAPFDATSPVLRACRSDQPEDTCVRPDPARGHVLNLESTGTEVRHQLRLSARQRFRLLNVSADYELQRVHGDVQGGAGTPASDSYDLRADWGRAPFPLHSAGATVNARLPLGVFLTARVNANSGRYYSIRTGRDDNRDGTFNDRPAGVPPNSLRGPKYANLDLNVSKAFFFRDGGTGPNVNVFANITNALNHVHYGTPSGVLTSPNFGRSTSASNPREIEAGLRFQF